MSSSFCMRRVRLSRRDARVRWHGPVMMMMMSVESFFSKSAAQVWPVPIHYWLVSRFIAHRVVAALHTFAFLLAMRQWTKARNNKIIINPLIWHRRSHDPLFFLFSITKRAQEPKWNASNDVDDDRSFHSFVGFDPSMCGLSSTWLPGTHTSHADLLVSINSLCAVFARRT